MIDAIVRRHREDLLNVVFVQGCNKLNGGFLKSADRGNLAQGNNLEDLRKSNFSTVLRAIHRARSISRSELSAMTGLNRSTISALVGGLSTRNLVNEVSENTSKKVGRPSTVVQANENTIAIAVNPEIDAVTVGVIGLGGHVHKRIRFETTGPPTIKETIKITAAIIDGLTSISENYLQIVGIGLAVPGMIRKLDGFVKIAPHLGWKDAPIVQMMENAVGFRTKAANDAFLGALAERTFGPGSGIADMVYMNGGPSGIGGGIIAGGYVVSGIGGYAGELGHIRITIDGEPDSAKLRGTLEAEVTREKLLSALNLESADFDELDHALRTSQSPAVLNEVTRQLEYLGQAIASLTNLLNPQLIILGGFLGSIYSMDTRQVQTIVSRETLTPNHENVRIARATLGVNQVILGAAELVFQGLFDDPMAQPFGKIPKLSS